MSTSRRRCSRAARAEALRKVYGHGDAAVEALRGV